MDEITIVRRRSRLWPVLLALVVLALIVLAVLWMLGSQPETTVGWNGIIDLGRRSIDGIT